MTIWGKMTRADGLLILILIPPEMVSLASPTPGLLTLYANTFYFVCFCVSFTAWADNADACAKQYAGTGALKTDFTRSVFTQQTVLMNINKVFLFSFFWFIFSVEVVHSPENTLSRQ